MNSIIPVDQLLAQSERIGVIGSPSTTAELSLDIMANAVTRKLVGELAIFQFFQDDLPHYAMGQITEVAMRNVWHEDPTMRSLIRQHGRVDAVSERQDTHQGKMIISAVFSHDGAGYQPSILGTVPATGTHIYLVDDPILAEILEPYMAQLFYLGRVYGSKPKLPLWFKHFDSGPNGAGEAYHLGVFGKTGSGKSVLTKMMLLAYARHAGMGMFILDPQGEFAQTLRSVEQPKGMGDVFCNSLVAGQGKEVQIYDLEQIQLDRWELFVELLKESNFFFDLGIKSSNYQDSAAQYTEDYLRSSSHKLSTLGEGTALLDALNNLLSVIGRIYTNPGSAADTITRTIDEIQQSQGNRVEDTWYRTARFFSGGGKISAEKIIAKVLRSNAANRPIVVVDLSKKPSDVRPSDWNDDIKPLIIDRFVNAIVHEAEVAYQNRENLNTLIVLDEAHRLVPQGRSGNPRIDRIKQQVVDAVRTTRKYGLGWMVISQTLSSLDAEIVQQLRIMFFGFGLSMGSEYEKLRQLVAGQKESLNLYQRFRDPQSAFDVKSREYSFMSIGPVSPLSFAGTPLFLNVFNDVDDFLESNALAYQRSMF